MAVVPAFEIVGGMCHLMKECVDSLGAVGGQQEVRIERDFDDVPGSVGVHTGEHVTQRRLHSMAQANGYVARKLVTEASVVEVVVQSPEVDALLRGRAACDRSVRRVELASSGVPFTGETNRVGYLWPVDDFSCGTRRGSRSDTAFDRKRCEGVQ